jgi:hypothetical protein
MKKATTVNVDAELLEESLLVAVDETGAVKPTELTTLPTTLAETEISAYLTTASQLDILKPAISLTPSYREFHTEGEKLRGVFLGLKIVQKKDNLGDKVPLECVQWLDPSGEVLSECGSHTGGGISTGSDFAWDGDRD